MMIRSACPEADFRSRLSDAEFWGYVLLGLAPGDAPDEPDLDDYGPGAVVPMTGTPCPECGEPGACAWDAEGRPLIHAVKGTTGDDR
jgi:hypothetical protein